MKPVTVHILTQDKFISADKRYDVECKTSGSRPNANISWYKGTHQMKNMVKTVSWYYFLNDFKVK